MSEVRAVLLDLYDTLAWTAWPTMRAELEGRSDDNEETVRRRLEVYREKTEPLVGYYEARGVLKRVDGLGTPDEVYARIRAALGI